LIDIVSGPFFKLAWVSGSVFLFVIGVCLCGSTGASYCLPMCGFCLIYFSFLVSMGSDV